VCLIDTQPHLNLQVLCKRRCGGEGTGWGRGEGPGGGFEKSKEKWRGWGYWAAGGGQENLFEEASEDKGAWDC